MPRITLEEMNRFHQQNGPLLTDAELAEQVAEKAKENEAKTKVENEVSKPKKRGRKPKAIETVEVAPRKKASSDIVDVFADTHELTEKFFGDIEYKRDYERLAFEISRWKEELNETIEAVNKGDADGVVDGAIDLITFVLGTLENFGVDGRKAWKVVHEANMAKEKGTKSSRPDSGGVDLIKPKGWKAPSHLDNLGMIESALNFD